MSENLSSFGKPFVFLVELQMQPNISFFFFFGKKTKLMSSGYRLETSEQRKWAIERGIQDIS